MGYCTAIHKVQNRAAFATGDEINEGLYEILMSPVCFVHKRVIIVRVDSQRLGHNRVGHVGKYGIQRMMSLEKGIDLEKTMFFSCEACQEGK